MKTFLVLTDFSEAAYYAASYACVLAKQLGVSKIVLYHSYKAIITPGESIVYTGDEKELHSLALKAMEELAASLADQVPQGCDLKYITNTFSLEEINRVTIGENAGMIIMGTTGKGKMEQIVAGSHAIAVCEISDVPVVLVPSGIRMQAPSNMVFACDLKKTEQLPKEKITSLLDAFYLPLSILHIKKEEEVMSSEGSSETMELAQWLESYHPAYLDIENDDTAEGILAFAAGLTGSIILLIAKKHGFPSGLFHRSITKQLAFHSTSPLLVLREKEEEAMTVPVMPLLEI
jgi:nucleotide-binding universal stress UspA family protein